MREGIAAVLGRQFKSVLCVPCDQETRVVGALELVDRRDGGSFTFDDVELTSLLGSIGGAALGNSIESAEVRGPADLATELKGLAEADPGRYAMVASIVSALLANG
jgi:hypothetical protein